jgi:predicted ATPase
LVLDNFEQVAAAAPAVAELLSISSHLKALVTSRVRLRVRGEREFPVAPLPVPPVGPTAERGAQLMEYAALTLFVERAREVRPAFALTDWNGPAVAEICRRLDGLPLAIELAAMRISHLSPQMLLAHLGQRLPLLTGGPRDLPARQQTLRDAIAWSYDLLTVDEQRLFRWLSVFAGGCTLEGADAVCGSPVLDGVGSLVEHSLLRQQERLEQPDTEPRFIMLETIREYAMERLMATGEADALRQRHADYFLALAEASGRLRGSNSGAWLDRLEREHDDLRAALDWFTAHGPAESALRLAGALAHFWRGRAYLAEGLACLARVLALPEAADRTTPAVAARWWQGVLQHHAGNYLGSRASFTQVLPMQEELGDRRGVGLTLWHLARIEEWEGDNATACALNERSLALLREVGSPLDVAQSLTGLGYVASLRGDLGRARTYLEESLLLYGASGRARMRGFALCGLGNVACDEGNLAEARRLFDEGLQVFRRLGDRAAVPTALEGFAGLAAAGGQPERAVRLAAAAAALREIIGEPLPPSWRRALERRLALARDALAESAYADAWAEGRAMSLELSITVAREED